MAVTVLIIDDSQGVRDTFPALLRLEGFQAVTAGDGVSGIAIALANPFDVILDKVLLKYAFGGARPLASAR